MELHFISSKTLKFLSEETTATVLAITSESEIDDNMDTLETITYLVAALGVIVLALCIVVASLLIYQYCR